MRQEVQASFTVVKLTTEFVNVMKHYLTKASAVAINFQLK